MLQRLKSTSVYQAVIIFLAGPLSAGCVAAAPSSEEWIMGFLTPEGEHELAIVSTNNLYRGKPKPTIRERRPGEREITSKASGRERGRIALIERNTGECVLRAGPRFGGVFFVRNKATNETVGRIRTGHSYSFLLGMSPCGEYVAYVVPGAFSKHGKVFVHHWRSKRRARLDVSPRWKLESWKETEE